MDRYSLLPNDIQDLIRRMIIEYEAARKIQKKFRNWSFRFTSNNMWKHLRILLCNRIKFEKLHTLMSAAMVQREWLCEPDSWIYSCTHHPEYLDLIVNEVKRGLWGQKCLNI